MSSRNSEGNGARILPIPPPLEFPYPECNATNATHPAAPSSFAQDSPTGREKGLPVVSPPTTDSHIPVLRQDITTPSSRPSLPKNKFVTERPVLAQRRSILHPKRRQTGEPPAALNTAVWDSDTSSSSSSSSEDEKPVSKIRSRTNRGQRAEKEIGADKPKTTAHRRDSEGGRYSRFSVGNDNYKTRGKVSRKDGRLNISVNETANSGYLAKALGATLHRHLGSKAPTGQHIDPSQETLSTLHEERDPSRPGYSRAATSSTISAASVYQKLPIPKLNIVIMVIGSRGDIQPFLKLGKLLKEEHGHRVRIATHPAFKNFVEEGIGLEFFSVGGDPAELMAFMVKNPGLVPSISTVRAGEIGRKRDSMFEMFQGFWRACINATDDETDIVNKKMMGDKHPFVADAIIANPPSFAHIHCAERLGIPLHIMFTFPYTPTQQFPHPLANIKKSNVDPGYTNFMSYPLVEMMTWQGLGDLVNRFRVKTLGLEPVSTLWAPGQLFRMKVPYTYLWSPGLIPKPKDWGPEIDIAGFVFLDLASAFEPPKALSEFLEAGDPPVYIGFGSIVVDDPDKFTSLIFEAVKKAGVRALVSKGWGGLGDEGSTPDNVFMLDNTPHDWLFPRVSAVVHHGGAGTTAIGLKCGKPTMIVPFFGDQPFWGAMVAQAGAGAHEPVPYKNLTVDHLAEGIKECLTSEAKAHAEELARDIEEEGDGAANAVKSFHRSLPLRGQHSMRCAILEDNVAVWRLNKTKLRLSALAADILVEKGKIRWQDLRLIRHYEWNDFAGPGEPLTGGGAALATTAASVAKGVAGTPVKWIKRIKKKEQHDQKVRARRKSIQANVPAKDNGSNGIDGNHIHNDMNTNGTSEILNHHEHVHGAPLTHTSTHTSTISEDNFAQDIANDTGVGLAETGGALAKAPMDLSVAIAQGFHNAPRLYGDSTVRRPTRITGFRSGLRAAGEEFTYGIYDGWTGLVVQPYKGAKEDGALGFVKGVGKGFGGFVLKDLAAILGPFAYTLKGVHKELVKGRQPLQFIRKARIIQGQKDLRALETADDKGKKKEQAIEKVNQSWHIILDIRDDFEAVKHHGIKGRIELYKQRKEWTEYGAFENVEQAGKALDAKREGQDLKHVMGRRRDAFRKADRPRKSTMSRAQRDGEAAKEAVKKGKDVKNEDEPGATSNENLQANGRTGTAVMDKAVGGTDGADDLVGHTVVSKEDGAVHSDMKMNDYAY